MDDYADSGWIKGLPADWIDAYTCARRLFARFKTEYANADPAPWHNVVIADDWEPLFGKSPAEYTFDEKMAARLVAVIQKAVCSGQLAPSWFDGSCFKSIPAHAFGNWRVVHGALLYGGFELDPLWPDDWQHWSNHGWAFPKEQFETWMNADQALPTDGLPMSESELPPCDVVAITSRMPKDASRVPLSEAISWIAFGIALDSERLARAISWQRLCDGDLQAAQRRLESATNALLKAGADGLVPMFGHYIESHGQKGQRTGKIDPLSLDDYRQALIIGQDELHYGNGLKLWQRTPIDSILNGSVRSDHYSKVTVEREALLKHFARLDSMDALLMPIPVALPEIGAVMGLAEAVSLLSENRPVTGTEIWEDAEGNWHFFDMDGKPVARPIEGEVPQSLMAFIEANRRLWHGLGRGELQSFVATDNGPVLSIPPLYWYPMNAECLEYHYLGTSNSDAGRGCPVLLSRRAFSTWRASLPDQAKPDKRDQSIKKRKPPGQPPDPDWPAAIDKVTRESIAAGYRRPLKRGEKAAIQTMLLDFMAEKDKHFSPDAAAKHAEKVIASLPDN